jgi:methyl-accepting chemotaxis protein
MAQARNRHRRSVWNSFSVEQSFKQRQIMRLLFLTFLNVLVSTGAFVAFHDYELSSSAGVGLYDQPTPSVVRIAIVWAALMAGLGGLFALMTGLLMTHRMAGPIHNFKRELLRIAEGEAPRPIRVRSGDEFADVALALNAALEALWARSDAAATDGALALDLDTIRSVHVEILEGLETFDLRALPEDERIQAEAWREQMRDLETKLNA